MAGVGDGEDVFVGGKMVGVEVDARVGRGVAVWAGVAGVEDGLRVGEAGSVWAGSGVCEGVAVAGRMGWVITGVGVVGTWVKEDARPFPTGAQPDERIASRKIRISVFI
jgi:hypothetical protein